MTTSFNSKFVFSNSYSILTSQPSLVSDGQQLTKEKMLRRLKLSQVKISHELLVNGISDSSVVWNRHLSTPTS